MAWRRLVAHLKADDSSALHRAAFQLLAAQRGDQLVELVRDVLHLALRRRIAHGDAERRHAVAVRAGRALQEKGCVPKPGPVAGLDGKGMAAASWAPALIPFVVG